MKRKKKKKTKSEVENRRWIKNESVKLWKMYAEWKWLFLSKLWRFYGNQSIRISNSIDICYFKSIQCMRTSERWFNTRLSLALACCEFSLCLSSVCPSLSPSSSSSSLPPPLPPTPPSPQALSLLLRRGNEFYRQHRKVVCWFWEAGTVVWYSGWQRCRISSNNFSFCPHTYGN